MGGLSLDLRMNFAKRIDDHVVYFKFFDFICNNLIYAINMITIAPKLKTRLIKFRF
jgi:hypothetical protein